MIRTNYCGFKIYEDSTRYVLARSSLAEEGVEGVITTANSFVCGHLSIGLDAMLQAVELPAGITDLDSSLANVYGDALTL